MGLDGSLHHLLFAIPTYSAALWSTLDGISWLMIARNFSLGSLRLAYSRNLVTGRYNNRLEFHGKIQSGALRNPLYGANVTL